VSKIVTWGHWIVGLLAVAIAAESIWVIVGNTVFIGRISGFSSRLMDANIQFVVLGAVCALCALGIFKWRPWGHVLALCIFAFEALIGGEAALVGDSGLLYPIAACLVLCWLLLPSVRSAYWHRVQTT
jgi:hypothetical protein